MTETGVKPRTDGWKHVEIGGLPVYAADAISSIPGVAQGFTTRHGGFGHSPYDSLNIGLNCGDDSKIVAANRRRLAEAMGFAPQQCAFAEQVHGRGVAVVRQASEAGTLAARADALVTHVPGVLLVLQFADCFPVYIVNPETRVIALAHSGWRGTAENVVQAVTDVMKDEFDSEPAACLVAIGPGISGRSYEVGEEVASRFATGYETARQPVIEPREGMDGKWSLHVQRAIYSQLIRAGYAAEAISACAEDTFTNQADFFSHRRESLVGLRTGRMAGVLGLRVGYSA